MEESGYCKLTSYLTLTVLRKAIFTHFFLQDVNASLHPKTHIQCLQCFNTAMPLLILHTNTYTAVIFTSKYLDIQIFTAFISLMSNLLNMEQPNLGKILAVS